MEPMDLNPRYARQRALPEIGPEGQTRLAAARLLIVGCGALGTVQAELLARAGVGHLTLVDRDLVEWSNLQRQLLFDEADAAQGLPKAEAAARRLRAINSSISIEPRVLDLDGQNLPALVRDFDLILDATDNAETRYALNDACVEAGIPWIYGGAVGTGGLLMAVRPGLGPCLRCLFPDPPASGSLPTCEMAGVLGSATATVAALQVSEVLRILVEKGESGDSATLCSVELWPLRFQTVSIPRDPGCPSCGQRRFDFLAADAGTRATMLCGRNAVQLSPSPGQRIELAPLAERLSPLGKVSILSESLLRFQTTEAGHAIELMVFPDARVIVKGTDDPGQARSLASRYIGV